MARDTRGTYHVGTPESLKGIVSAPVVAEPGKPLPPGVEGPEALMESGIGRPIRIGPALLAAQDESQRSSFIANWKHLISGE